MAMMMAQMLVMINQMNVGAKAPVTKTSTSTSPQHNHSYNLTAFPPFPQAMNPLGEYRLGQLHLHKLHPPFKPTQRGV